MSVDDDFIDRVLDGEVSEEEAAEFQTWLKFPETLERHPMRSALAVSHTFIFDSVSLQGHAYRSPADNGQE